MNRFKFRAWCILEKKGSFIYFDLEDRCTFNFEIFDQEPIFQQYTGLKDKNDKEIYEGDLVCCSTDQYSITAPVVFSPFGYGLLSPLMKDEKTTYEVVGNIFENNTNE
jgi:hypothetical protein